MTVYRICSRNPDTIVPTATVRQAAEMMNSRNVGSLVVVDEENRPLAMLTDRDLAIKALTQSRDADTLTVGDCMSQGVLTIPLAASVESALGAMRSGPHRRLPVVDDTGVLCGVISVDDVIQHLMSEFRLVNDLLARESPSAISRT